MGGNVTGGRKAAAKNKASNPNFYADMGRLGGQVIRPHTRYFAVNREAAKAAGKIGGQASRKGAKDEQQQR